MSEPVQTQTQTHGVTHPAAGWRRGAALLAGLLVAACAAATPPAVGSGASTEEQAKTLIGDAGCSTDSQCHSIAWGAKACGGPERYIAWSALRTDPQALQDLARRHAAERENQNQRNGTVSTCSMQMDPGAHCAAQHCQLGGGVGGSVTR